MKIKLVLAGLLLMTVGGGVWSLPALKLSRSREPWLALLLFGGLAGTIIALRYLISGGFQYDFWIWLAAVGVFLSSRFFTGVKRSVEPFFAAHVFAIILTLIVSTWKNAPRM